MDPIAGSDLSRPYSSQHDPNGTNQAGARSAASHIRWRRDALHPRQVQHGVTGRDTCGRFPVGGQRCTTWNTRGLVGSVLSSQKNRELKHNYFKKLLDCNNILCLQEVHGKDEILQALQVLAPNFRLFGTFFPGNENAGGSAI